MSDTYDGSSITSAFTSVIVPACAPCRSVAVAYGRTLLGLYWTLLDTTALVLHSCYVA